MRWYGDVKEGGKFIANFNTVNAEGLASAPNTALAAADFVWEKDGVAATITGTLAYATNAVGRHRLIVSTTGDTDLTPGSDYMIAISTGAPETVDGIPLRGLVVAEFSIENRWDESDLKKMRGSTQSAIDLKDFADAGYDPATNKVQGLVLADALTGTPTNFSALTISTAGAIGTVTTNTDMRGTDSALLAASAPTNWGNFTLTTGGSVTVGTNSDKTGYSLTQAFPTNFAALSISTAGAIGTVTTNTDMRGTDSAFLAASAPTNFGSLSISTAGAIGTVTTNTDMRGTDSAFLAASAPTNFGNLSISTAGAIGTVTTNTDMRGTDSAFLAASAPTNIGALGISTAGAITTVTTNTDMRGTDSALLAASAPTNFGSLTISTAGRASADMTALTGDVLQGAGTTADKWRPV